MGKAKSVKNIVSKLSDDVIQEAAERTAKEASNIRTAQISQAVTNANAGIRLDNMDDMLRHRVDAKAAFGSKDFIPSDQVTPFDRLTQQDGGQLSLFDTPASNKPINTTSEYLPRKTTSLNGEEVTVYDKNPNYKKPEKNTPIKQVEGQEAFQVNNKTGEIDTKASIERKAREARAQQLNEMNGRGSSTMHRRTLGEWADQMIHGTGDETHIFSGRNTRRANMEQRNIEINAANQEWVETGVGNLQRPYNRGSYWAEVRGKGKPVSSERFNADDWGSINSSPRATAENVAEEAASSRGFLDYAGDAVNWAVQDVQHAMLVTGGAIGIGFIGSELLDEE